MAYIHLEDKKEIIEHQPKTKVFGSAVDLAHVFNKDWAMDNINLTIKADAALLFIQKDLKENKKPKNFIKAFLYDRKLNKARHCFKELLVEYRYLVSEVEALIGFNSYLKSGVKSKIKNKKRFDDHVTERREILIMLMGLILFIQAEKTEGVDFSNEIEIIDTVSKHCNRVSGYFAQSCAFMVTFEY